MHLTGAAVDDLLQRPVNRIANQAMITAKNAAVSRRNSTT
jgi:hypothetical protein